MKVDVRCFASLAREDGCHFRAPVEAQLPDAARVNDLMRKVDVRDQDVSLIFVNGLKAAPDARLEDGDRVGLFPPVGGM